MWWEPVFWILLIPLIVIEFIVFTKTKKLFWLIYALSIFVYVVSVSYTLDVFAAGRNAIIITLLASSALMALVGRQLGRAVQKQKSRSYGAMWAAVVLGAVIILLFTVSVVFGRLQETTTAVSSVTKESILPIQDPQMQQKFGETGVVLLHRTITNSFFLPVPIKQKNYIACIATQDGSMQMISQYYGVTQEEVPGGATITTDVKFSPFIIATKQTVTPKEVLVYEFASDVSQPYDCQAMTSSPIARIPITAS